MDKSSLLQPHFIDVVPNVPARTKHAAFLRSHWSAGPAGILTTYEYKTRAGELLLLSLEIGITSGHCVMHRYPLPLGGVP